MKTLMVLLIVLLFQFSCAPRYTASFHEYHYLNSVDHTVTSSQNEKINLEEPSSGFSTKETIASVSKTPTEFKGSTKIGVLISPVVKKDQVVNHVKKNKAERKEFNQERNKWKVGDYVVLILLIGLLACLVFISVVDFTIL